MPVRTLANSLTRQALGLARGGAGAAKALYGTVRDRVGGKPADHGWEAPTQPAPPKPRVVKPKPAAPKSKPASPKSAPKPKSTVKAPKPKAPKAKPAAPKAKPAKPKAAPKPPEAKPVKKPGPHHVLNNPVVDPDPTEWPDPYDKREDPRGPDHDRVPGATSTSEPHPAEALEPDDRRAKLKHDKLDQ